MRPNRARRREVASAKKINMPASAGSPLALGASCRAGSRWGRTGRCGDSPGRARSGRSSSLPQKWRISSPSLRNTFSIGYSIPGPAESPAARAPRRSSPSTRRSSRRRKCCRPWQEAQVRPGNERRAMSPPGRRFVAAIVVCSYRVPRRSFERAFDMPCLRDVAEAKRSGQRKTGHLLRDDPFV